MHQSASVVNPPALLQRLGRLRRSVRAALAWHAGGLLLAVAAWASLLLVLADYWEHFPGSLRLILLAVLAAALVAIPVRRLIGALLRPLPDRFLAGKLEQAAALGHDELLSAVDFLKRDLGTTNALAAASVTAATDAITAMNVSGAVDFRPVRRMLLIGVAGVAMLAALAAFYPAQAGLAWRRWSGPLAHHPWPRHTRVSLVWNTVSGAPPAIWPRGKPLSLQARVNRGFYPGLPVWLQLRQDGRPLPAQLMTWQGRRHGTRFATVIVPVGAVLQVRAAAGDDTREPWQRILLAPRPRIVSLMARISPPAYAPTVPPYVVNLMNTSAQAIVGSTVVIHLRSDQPLAAGPALRRAITPVRGGAEPLRRTGPEHSAAPGRRGLAHHAAPLATGPVELLDARTGAPLPVFWMVQEPAPHQATLIFSARKSFAAQLRLIDRSGIANRRGALIQLNVRPDAPPRIWITHPGHTVETTPDGTLSIHIQARDDLGLTPPALLGRRTIAPPRSPLLFTLPLRWQRLVFDPATRTVRGAARTIWSLKDLKPRAGESIDVYAQVGDNYRVQNAAGAVRTHPLVLSAPLRVVIRTRAEIEAELRGDLRDVRAALKSLLKSQRHTQASTQAIAHFLQTNRQITPAQRATLAALGRRQAAEAARAASITGTLRRIERMATRNGLSQRAVGKLARFGASQMAQVSQQLLPRAAAALRHAATQSARLAPPVGGQAWSGRLGLRRPALLPAAIKSAARAVGGQQRAIVIMRQLLQRLGAAGRLASLETQTARLLRRQELLQRQLGSLAPRTIGMTPSQLPPRQRTALAQLAHRQKSLALRADQLARNLTDSAQRLKRRNPALAAALRQAADLASQRALSSTMRLAAQAAAQNQMQHAAANQDQARQTLAHMLRALRQARQRSLQRQISRLAKLIALIKRLLQQQQAVKLATARAPADGPARVLAPLADRESRLQLRALAAGGQAQQVAPSTTAGAWLRHGAHMMGQATGALLRGEQPLSIPSQNQAQAALQHALTAVRRALRQDRLRQQLSTLRAIRKRYRKIARRQRSLLADTSALRRRWRQHGGLQRTGLLKLQSDGQAQATLRNAVNVLSSILARQTPVIVWLNGKIAYNMKVAVNILNQASVNRAVPAAQTAALMGLTDILQALKQQIRIDKVSSGSGGGGGGGGQPPLIPPAAQLKLLKVLQVQINQTTQQLNQQLLQNPGASAHDALLQQVRQLGGMQTELRGQVIKVVQSLPHPASSESR